MPLRTTEILDSDFDIMNAPTTPDALTLNRGQEDEYIPIPGTADQDNTYTRNRYRKNAYHGNVDYNAPVPTPKQVYGETLTAKQRAGIAASFTTDNPLSCIEDERARARVEYILNGETAENAARQKKAIALAHYYSMGHREDTGFIFENIEAAIEKFEGKKMSVEQAYASIAEIFQPKYEKGILENEYAAAFLHGEARVANAVFDVAAFLGKVFGYFGGAQARAHMMELGLPELAEQMPTPAETAAATERGVRRLQEKGEYKDLEKFFGEKMNMPDDWFLHSGSIAGFIKNASIALVDFAPQLAAQTGIAVTGGPLAIGGVFGVSGYYEAKEEHGMEEAKALLYGAGIGLINGALEKVTLGILEGKITRDAAKEGIKKGLGGMLKHYGISLAMEGTEEALEEVSENILDMIMGVTDTTNFTTQDYAKALFKGAPEAFFLGAATSGIFSTPSYFNLRERADANERTRALVSGRIEELKAKDTLTDTEEKQLETLNIIQDAGNMEAAYQAAEAIRANAEARRIEEQRKAEEADAELTDEERLELEAENTLDRRNLDRTTGWNIQDTIDTVRAFAPQFPAFSIETVSTVEELPEHVKKEQQARGFELARIDAAWDGEQKVYIVANKVRPSEAGKKVLHEIVGHAGLQAVFGERFDSFLESVYEDRIQDIENGHYAERYNTTPDTKEGQRYLAGEFLAEMAESDTKPGWWKEFISKIRAYLRRVFPSIHFTDADIEHELARSARATRKTKPKEAQGKPTARFSLDQFSEKDKRDFITILKPKYAKAAFVEPSEAKAYLESVGETGINENDAWSLYQQAGKELHAEQQRQREKRRDDWLYQNNQLWRDVVDYIGNGEVLIRPAYRFRGMEFKGTFISPEWRQYSLERKQGDKESDKSYSKYKRKREEALASAKGVHSDVLAEAIARKYGRDTLDVEEEIIEYFQYLTKKDLYGQYTKFIQEENYRNRQAEAEAREAYEAYRRGEIEDEVVDIITRGEPITREYVEANMDVFNELYRQLVKEEPPKSKTPTDYNLERVNEGITNEHGRAEGFAAAYKAARDNSWKAYQKMLSDLKFEAMKNKADAAKLQREALKFAEENLPEAQRGEFTRGILRLLEYSTSPSKKYPEGRRLHEFRNLLEQITEAAQEQRTESSIANIKDMLESARMKRNWKGIPVSVLPSQQANVDRIRKIVDMNPATVANAMDYNNERIQGIEEALEDANLTDDARALFKAELEQRANDNMLLDKFGNLTYKKPGEVKAAEEALQRLIRNGKYEFGERLKQRFKDAENMRLRAIDDATFGKQNYATQEDAKKHIQYELNLSSIQNILRLVSGKSIQDFDNSIGGELAREIEDSTQKEATIDRKFQEDFDNALRKYANVTGNPLAFMLKKGKVIRELKEQIEESGVFKREYSRVKPIGDGAVVERGRRTVKKQEIKVEDYEYMGKTMPGARSLLRAIDNGEQPYIAGEHGELQNITLDEIAIGFLRKQLEDYDAGIRRTYEMFSDEGDKEAAKRIQEESGRDTLWLLRPRGEEDFKMVQVPLSQGSALQILFTWEQEDYRLNMKWNGWTEDSIEQIKKFLKPETIKLGNWMREYIARNKKDLDAVVYERYGAHLPQNNNYWPGEFKKNRSDDPGAMMRGAGTMSINPSFLIARKFHLDPVNLKADAFSVFFDNQLKQAHFISWYDTIRKLREVYGYSGVKDAINENFGENVTKTLQDQIATLARGGQAITSYKEINAFFSKMYRYWVPTKIAANISSIAKQMLGVTAYANDMPLIPFIQGISEANFLNPNFREWIKWAKETDYIKNRMSGGLDKDLLYMLNNTRDAKQYSPIMDALLSASTWFTRKADAWSALHGGYAVYEYTRKQAKKRGLTEAEAHEAARREWMRATDETQQSGYLKDLNYYQQNQGLIRYLTVFRSNPIQLLNLEMRTLRELRYGKNKGEAGKKLARQIFVNHLILPTMMLFVTDMMRKGLDVFDEGEMEDYFTAWIFGPFESGTTWLQILYSSANIFLDMGIRDKPAPRAAAEALPLLEETYQDAHGTFKLFKDEEVTTEEVMDGIKFAGDIGMFIGGTATPAAPAGSIGTVLNALATQGKRFIRLFKDEENK